MQRTATQIERVCVIAKSITNHNAAPAKRMSRLKSDMKNPLSTSPEPIQRSAIGS
eukprot:CAMPEP_0179859520 /NCGR_PEP_ID=MMETSP0982-20121206/13050_1 /TAXON_ID=483367 /ORGANISM="non described non described, Strain CCMP 2436" /LENGTH=54 /DNA_ID=CAMNT_0021746557 /DNA_START=112 /DNA_END=272 /DNA_ORIENTATION=-